MAPYFVCVENAMGGITIVFVGNTHADCERFIAQRLAQQGRERERADHYRTYHQVEPAPELAGRTIYRMAQRQG